MNKFKYKYKFENYIYIYLLIYLLINIFFLRDFPFVHSDEPWLSGLSRAMLMNGDFSVTEPFFDAYERNPHAIKILFHFIQIIFIKLIGYNVFSFRLISLLFSIGTLYFFNKLCKNIFQSDRRALFTTILLSLDIQYIYGSHFARQEIIILFAITLSIYILLHKEREHNYLKDISIGTIIGLSIGIHPNSFIAALAIGSIYMLLIFKKKIKLKNLLLLILIVGLFALIFIGISLYMNEDFFENYSESGKTFGVHNNIEEKILKGKDFYKNIYWSKSVTYYLPNIKFQLLLFTLCFILTLTLLVKNRRRHRDIEVQGITVALLFINLGIIMIGRYNVTSILFIFPFMYLLVAYTLINIQKTKQQLFILLFTITCINTASNITSYSSTYNEYISGISSYVDTDDRVLSNLNSEYYFDSGNMFDYRNLQFIKEQGMSFEEYITSRNIEYIIYYDEIDYIYEKNPIYNGVYGDVSMYYDEMQAFLNKKCHRVHSFTNSTYGTNIVRVIDEREWKVHIYEVSKNQG